MRKTFKYNFFALAAAFAVAGCWRSQVVELDATPDGGDTESDTSGGITDPGPDTEPQLVYIWSPAETPTEEDLSGVFGFSSDDVFAVGRGGAILHFDGAAWSAMAYPAGTPTSDLGAVWGSAPDDVFAVGAGGVILRFDGSDWGAMAAPVSTDLRDLCGRGANDVFAVGDSGTLLAFDGTSWSAIPTDVQQNLVAVWCAPGTDVFAGGHLNDAYGSTAVVSWDGSAAAAVDHPIGHFLYALGGFPPDGVFLGGAYQDPDEALHFELYRSQAGGAFSFVGEGAALLIDLFAVATDELWAVGRLNDEGYAAEGAVYHVVDGEVGAPSFTGGTDIYRGVWRDPSDPWGTVFAVGDGGAILMGVPQAL